MKRMKKCLLFALCTLIIGTATACGSENAADNGADQSTTDENVNDATKGTVDDDKNTNGTDEDGNGIVNDAVDDVTDGVDRVTDDITDGVDRATDDMTRDNGADNTDGTAEDNR